MTINFAARLRFMITKSGRSTMVNALMKMAGINTIEDATTELSPARIARDNADLKKVVDQIKTSGNPFDGNAPPTLFNISFCITFYRPTKYQRIGEIHMQNVWR